MPTKLQFYADIADNQARQVTGSRETWTDFLTTAGRLYKYPFEEQLMIYAQRPNATACAELETWNKPMNRFVRKGSKGIALIDQSGDRPRLRYVFDYADTENGRYNARRPFLWEMRPQHKSAVVDALDKAYDINTFMGWDSFNGRAMIGNDVGDVIFGLAHELAARYYNDNARDIGYSVEDSFLEDYDEDNISVAFREALTVSAAYSIMTRCGIDPADYLMDEDFHPIFDFNTPDTVYTLGKAVSAVTEEVLREIETTIKKYERERNNEYGRNDLHTERGLSYPRYSGTENSTPGQIRNDAEIVSERPPSDIVFEAGAVGEAISPLSGNRNSGGRTADNDNDAVVGAVTAAGQGDRPDGLDGAHEQSERPGGGNDLQRTDLQLDQEIDTETEPTETPSDMGSVSLFPTEREQITAIREAEQLAVEPAPFIAVTISQDDIDNALREWNGGADSIRRVNDYMSVNGRSREAAAFLQNEYGQSDFTVTKDGAEPVTLPWHKVQRRVAQLIAENDFIAVEESTVADIPEAVENTAISEPETEAELTSPAPVFLPDKNAVHNLDLSLYNDGDTLGYDQNGVEYSIMRMGEHNFINTTTRITPMGDILGVSDIPADILRQIRIARGLETPELEQPAPISSPSYEHYLRAKERYPNHTVITTLGDFNEFHGEDALYVADALGYSVVRREVDGQEIPLVGIPKHSTVAVIAQLNERGRDVIYVNTYGAMVEFPHSDTTQLQSDVPESEIQDTLPQGGQITLFDYPRDISAAVPETQAIPGITTKIPERRQNQPPAVNFRITDEHLGEGGAKTKYSYNIVAIRTLRAIEAENRRATPEEQEVLSRYVGWGGLPQAFERDNQGWAKEYAELQSLLTPEEYNSARASTLNAHYTSPTVIKAMYETLERLGVKDGNILEPACGVGNFFGLLPDSMRAAKLYGVELDGITGRIAKQLYQNADIQITGFEKTTTPDAFFDVAVGNVPFGSYTLADKRYDKQSFLVHDYFFAKALDQVRPGGIVAFVTSKGTMDKANSEVRRYLAQRAELLGAVRLPNTAFKANAGTEVTSDIIFLQKRDRLIDIQPDWVNTWHNEDGILVNRYFADNPHMVLGTMTTETTQYGHDTTCKPIEGADLGEQLREALSHIQGQITEIELDDIEGIRDISIPADPSVRNFSYTIADGMVYYRENSRMNPVDMPAATLERVKGMVEMRDCVPELIDYQLHDYPDRDIRMAQSKLNRLYDSFTRKYGLINDNANNKAFSADSAYYLLCSLEVIDENGSLERKSDMFTQRTIKQKTEITSVDTSAEALAVSIAKKARVNMDYMRELTGFTDEKIVSDLTGVIFRIPDSDYYIPADEYLSGNVRKKLLIAQAAAESDPAYAVNVKALELAQPKDLDASEISVRLGSTWIDKQYIQQFMFELLQPSRYLRNELAVNFSEHTGEWNIAGKTKAGYGDIPATVTYGTERMNAYKIIEESLNLKDVRVYDTKIVDGKETRVLNKKETTLAQQKQEALKEAFKDWIFRDPERRQTLVQQYNERFNSIRTREYDGSHIEFTGISPEIKLKPHQRDAIARILYGGNTLLAHEVGAGKTFEMVGAAMESKRLGLCQKSLMAVPNHLTEQMASEFLRLYPSANILVATKKDFETKNRKKFCAKIATGDYDAVIIGHSQLEKIPLSKERQERLLNEQIDEITDSIEELKENNGERFTIKQLEKTRKSLEARLEKLTDDSRKDDVVTFEQLGVDRLFVDESHNFKELYFKGSFKYDTLLKSATALFAVHSGELWIGGVFISHGGSTRQLCKKEKKRSGVLGKVNCRFHTQHSKVMQDNSTIYFAIFQDVARN